MKYLKKHFIASGMVALGAAIFLIPTANSHNVEPGEMRRVEGSFEFGLPDKVLSITPLDNGIFHVTRYTPGTAERYAKSQSAKMEALATDVRMVVTPSYYLLHTPDVVIRVNKKTGLVTFLDHAAGVLLAEAEGVENEASPRTAKFLSSAGESFYGAGERGQSLRLNGDSLPMYNRPTYGYGAGDKRINQMNITVPWLVSDKGYGVLFDDFSKAMLTTGDTIAYSTDSSRPLSYYFVTDNNRDIASVVAGYSRLTGQQPLPPFWSLGYITSKYGYHNDKETLGSIDSLKNDGYPVDGIVLDLYWYGKEQDMGRLEWNKDAFPDPKGMMQQLRDKGVKTVLISQPYINKGGAIDNYNLLSSRGLLARDASGKTHDVTTWVGDAGMFDVSNPATRRWLWDRYKSLTDGGVEGWWGDLGEPEVHPETIIHANGMPADEYHNVYGNEWSRIIAEGFAEDFPDRRLMLLMRGGTAGLQRYGVMPWSGDVGRSWEGLQAQIPIMLNTSLSGLGYMSSDIGGFAVDPKHPVDPELYVRWMQMGVFTPTLRTHAQFKPEPYHYPKQKNILLDLVKMRYRWLPYNYTLAYENAELGLPLARPLNFRKASEKYADVEDEYLWGDEVLVAPVMKKGAVQRAVLFPEGADWIDWSNPAQSYKGGSTATVKAPLDKLPLFVRAGSFIPQYEGAVESTEDYDPRLLTIKYFPSDKETSYTLFDDDRRSPRSLQDKQYQLTTFTGKMTATELNIGITAEGRYENIPSGRLFTFEIPQVKKAPAEAEWNGEPLPEAMSPKAIRQYGYSYDSATKILTIRIPYNYDPASIKVKF